MKDHTSFESALKRLEDIVSELEAGDIPLEESIKVFEEGNKLVTFCLSKLEAAEKQIMKLSKDADGKIKLENMT